MATLSDKLRQTLQVWRGARPPERREASLAEAVRDAVIVQSMEQLRPLFERLGDSDLTSTVKISKGNAAKYFRRWQYVAGTVLADGLTMVDYEVQRRRKTSRGVEWAEDAEHPVATLFRKPNPFMPFRFLMYYMALDLYFTGEAYWKIVFNGIEEPAELWPLMGQMKILPDPETFIKGYELTYDTASGPRKATFQPDEIVAFRLPMLQNAYEGASPFGAMSGSVKLDEEMLKSRYKVFKNGIFPSLVVFMTEPDPKRRQEIMAEINERYASSDNAGKAIGLRKEHMDVKDVRANTAREMDFTDSVDGTRDEVLAAGRTPPILAGITRDVQNRAVAEAAEYVYAKWAIAPKLALIEEQLNGGLIWPCYGEDVRMHFYSPVPEDAERERADEDMLVRNHVLTINEVRAKRGYEPVEWGDKPLVSIGVAPLGEGMPEDEGQIAGLSLALPAETVIPQIGDHVEVLGYNKTNRRAIARAHVGQQAKFGKSYAKAWGKGFGELKGELLDALGSGQSLSAVVTLRDARGAVDKVLQPARLAKRFRDASKPYVVRGLILGGQFDGELVAVPGRAKWGADSKALLDALRQFDEGYYRGVADTTHKRMIAVVAQLIEERATWEEIRAAVEETFDAWASGRAANIATTETTRLMGAGGQAFREEFELTHKQWIASFVNTRDTHADADGQTRRNGEAFDVGADRMQYPGGGKLAEENCNCNCAAVAVPK